MEIGGLNTFSLSDFPGKVSAVVFTQGCNFNCRFCHNGFLIPRDVPNDLLIPERNVFELLKRRRNQLDGVVVSGGEPSIQPDLSTFLDKIKTIGFAVKLDTNGSRPGVLKELLTKDLVDYIAMDVKAPLYSYKTITQINASKINKIKESIDLIAKSGVEHEFRTTVVPDVLKKEDILKIVDWIKPAKKYYLQNYRAEKTTIDPEFMKKKPYSEEFLLEIKKEISSFFDVCKVR